VVLAVAAAGAVMNACLHPVKSAKGDTARDAAGRKVLADAAIGGWWNAASRAAQVMVEKYDVPDEVRSGYFVWNGNGHWKRTVVRNVTPPYGPAVEVGVLEQTILYPLTPGQVVELEAYDRNLDYDRDTRELTARSDREDVNFLRLNLADDIANNRMTPAQASHLHARILELENSGKSSPYMQGLRFAPDAN
jgi:hypothetical protein